MKMRWILFLMVFSLLVLPACGGGGGGGGGSMQVPTAPTSLQINGTTTTSASISWVDNATDENGFYVERSSSAAGPFAVVASTGSNTQNFTEYSLSASTNYYYRVCAYNSAGNSSYTNVQVAATQSGGGVSLPSTPTGLTASATSSSSISLAWTDNSSNESYFKVERSTSPSSGFIQIGTASTNVTSYTSSGLSSSTTYYYRVRAYNSAGNSGYTNTANATTQSGASIPSAPSGLTASATSSSSISLAWTDNSSNESYFKVERSTSPSSGFAQIGTASTNVTSYTSSSLNSSTTYYYRVRAYNASGNSGYTNTANATTQSGVSIPSAPSGLTASAASSSSIGLAWTDNSNNETGFKIFRSGSANGTFLQRATVGAGVTSYTNTGLSGGSTYYYRVQSYNAAGNSSSSNTASATTSVASGTLRILNNTHYYMVDIRLNNVQKVYYPSVIWPEGYSADWDYSPGTVSYSLGVGFYNANGTRDVWFTYTGSATVTGNQTTTVTFPNPTIGQLLTNFSSYRDWDGYYFDCNSNYQTTRYRIYSSGTYYFYINEVYQGSGTVSLTSWPTHGTAVGFNLRGGATTIYYPFGTFQKNEGLSGCWSIIEYN